MLPYPSSAKTHPQMASSRKITGTEKNRHALTTQNYHSMLFFKEVLVEERGPVVARCAIPRESGAPGERGSLAEIGASDPSAQRLVDKANTCPLSFDLEVSGPDGALSGSGVQPLLAVFIGSASPEVPQRL